MNRNQIKITNKDRADECRREISMRKHVYAKQVERGHLQPYQANKRILILVEYQELAEKLEARGLTWDDLHQLIDQAPGSRTAGGKQSELFPV